MAQFGNWLVTLEGIKYTGIQNDPESVSVRMIPTSSLLTNRNGNLYDWLLHIAKPSFTREDIYTFNTAFVFALEFNGLGFSPTMSLMETFREQARQIQENEEEEPDEFTIGGGQ